MRLADSRPREALAMGTMTGAQMFEDRTSPNVSSKNDAAASTPDWAVTLKDVSSTLRRRILAETKTRPELALGIAAAVGFVLGGGLATRLGRLTLLGLVEMALRDQKRVRE